MNALSRFDTTALNRALIGFDRVFNEVERRISNTPNTNYPPFNILQHDDNSYEIEIAVAGFNREDITVKVDRDQLFISGKQKDSETTAKYLHKGLAARDFVRVFTLADHMEITQAEMTNGILCVKIVRVVPEELKPRVIEIK